MSRDLIKQLKSLKQAEVRPSEKWLKNNRELLLSQIKNTVTPKEKTKFNFETVWQAMSIFLPYSFVHKVVRPIVVLLLVVGMGISSWVVAASASSESLPGEWLYSAKRVAEKTQVIMADVVGDTNGSTMLHVEFAKRRAEETRDIVSQNDPSKIEIAAQTVSDLKEEMRTVSTKLEEIKTTQDSKAEMAQNINQNAQEIKDVLKEVKVNLLTNSDTTSSSDDLSAQVSEVKNLAKDTAVRAVEIMVEKHLQGDTTVSKDDVKQAINVQLQSAIKDANDSKQSVDEVNKVLGVVKTEVDGLAHDAKGTDLVSTTQALSDKIDATSKQTQAAVSSTKQFNVVAGKTVDEGQMLLSQDNLTSAVDKIKEANTATTQSEKITDDTLKAVQNVLPVVAVATDAPIVSTTVVLATTTSSSLNIILSVSTTIKITTSTPAMVISSSTGLTTTKK
ncbi:MAG: hypothetical protein G01um101413_93 [Parcubacteria group bacterium Gr01-1014_13]|nr:MAG: hypothetical protein G01um101413_93 [Parcubacteria group bacterium Gr01-1014_13]